MDFKISPVFSLTTIFSREFLLSIKQRILLKPNDDQAGATLVAELPVPRSELNLGTLGFISIHIGHFRPLSPIETSHKKKLFIKIYFYQVPQKFY